MEFNDQVIEFTVVAKQEIMQRCVIEINGLSGSIFELVKFEENEVPICSLRATKWKLEYIFMLGTIFQRFNSMPTNKWRIP